MSNHWQEPVHFLQLRHPQTMQVAVSVDHHRNGDEAAAAAAVTGTVRANTRRERQSSHCMNQLHSWREPDEKLEGSFFLTLTRQKSILRGSEIFGYDEKEYPERMPQRAAGWCKAVQGVRGKILSELSG